MKIEKAKLKDNEVILGKGHPLLYVSRIAKNIRNFGNCKIYVRQVVAYKNRWKTVEDEMKEFDGFEILEVSNGEILGTKSKIYLVEW